MRKLLTLLLFFPCFTWALTEANDAPMFGSIEPQSQTQNSNPDQGQYQSMSPTTSNSFNQNASSQGINGSQNMGLRSQPNPVANANPMSSLRGIPNVPDDNDQENNIHVHSSTHMGDVLNFKLPVFGFNLFGNQCSKLHQARFFNPEYRLAVGDEVSIQIWGAFRMSQKLTVDTQGNIFLPEVGPIKVEG